LILSKRIENRVIISIILTSFLFFIIFGPVIYFGIKIGYYASNFDLQIVNNIIEKVKGLLDFLPDNIKNEIMKFISSIDIEKIYKSIISFIGAITKKGAVFLKDTFLIVIFFFFFLLYGKKILFFLERVFPLEDKKLEKIFLSISEVMSIVFYSTLVTAILEGVLFGIIVAVYGFGLMTPIGWKWAAFMWVYALSWFVFNDGVKKLVLRYYRKKIVAI